MIIVSNGSMVIPGVETALPPDTCKMEGDVEKFNKVIVEKLIESLFIYNLKSLKSENFYLSLY